MSDPFKEIFGDLFSEVTGTDKTVAQLQLEIVSLKGQLEEEKARNERLKKKARRLIDVAYNRALNDMRDRLSVDVSLYGEAANDHLEATIIVLKRTVRED